MGNFGPNNELKAPPGKFRVIGVDTFEGPLEDYLIGDFEDKDVAIKTATNKAGDMNPCYVYDDQGKRIFGAGRP